MDWGLVLASQGIEPLIEEPSDGTSWGLVVPPQEYSRAVEAIRQYELENRHWPWQQEVIRPGILFDWASVAWALLLLLFFWLSEGRLDLRTAGAMDRLAVSHGQWWRLFTAIWLHADLAHLAGNAGLGAIFLGLAMGRYGTPMGLFGPYLAGVGANVLVWLVAPGRHESLGASGMVMGAVGVLAVPSIRLWRQNRNARKFIVSGLFGGVFLFVFLGTNPGTDVLAHAGGFLSGLVLGVGLSRLAHPERQRVLNILSGIGFVLLVLWPWWLALSHGSV